MENGVQLKCDGTRWRTGGEVKGKLANGMGSQYPSHYLGTWCIQHYYRLMRTPRLPVVDWTDAPADLNGLVRCAERRNLVSARVPSHFKSSLTPYCMTPPPSLLLFYRQMQRHQQHIMCLVSSLSHPVKVISIAVLRTYHFPNYLNKLRTILHSKLIIPSTQLN